MMTPPVKNVRFAFAKLSIDTAFEGSEGVTEVVLSVLNGWLAEIYNQISMA